MITTLIFVIVFILVYKFIRSMVSTIIIFLALGLSALLINEFDLLKLVDKIEIKKK
jgi:hypothetical protein